MAPGVGSSGPWRSPTWDRRLRILADWIIWPIVGRDVVQMGPRSRPPTTCAITCTSPARQLPRACAPDSSCT